jgi:hypothetical protein
MVEIVTILDILAAILLIIPAIYVFKLGNLTGWFKAWTLVAVTFIVAILLRLLFVYQPYSSLDATTFGYIRASLNLVVSVCALLGYTSLYKLFKEKK